MRTILGVMLSVFLCGCSYVDYLRNSQGVHAPSPAEVSSYVQETEADTIVEGSPRQRIAAGEYLVASWAYTDQRCHEFFDLLERFKQDSSLLDKVLTAAIAASSPLPKSTLASVTTSLAFANQVNLFTADIFAFSAFKDQLMPQVFGAMRCYRQQHKWQRLLDQRIEGKLLDERLRFLQSTKRVDLMIARGIAQEYASLCSLASLRSIMSNALANTRTVVAGASSPVSPMTIASYTGRLRAREWIAAQGEADCR